MRTVTDWQNFDTHQEAKALGDYITAKWDGITAAEAQTLALHAFHRGWDAVGEYFDNQTVNGLPMWSAEKYQDRIRLMDKLEFSPLMRSNDSVLKVLVGLSRLERRVQRPQSYDEGVTPLVQEALQNLGSHLKKMRPKGWSGARASVYKQNKHDQELFDGVITHGPVGANFLEGTSLAYVKSGVSNHGDDPFTLLVGFMYAHGFKTHAMANGEAMGKVVQSIDPNQPYVGPRTKVKMVHEPFVEGLLQKYDKAVLKNIDWFSVPTSELSAQPF